MSHTMHILCALVLYAASSLSNCALANTPPTTTRTYLPIEDAYIRDSPYRNNVYNNSNLKVKTKGSNSTYRSYIKLPDIGCDSSMSCEVELSLFVISAGKTTYKTYSTDNGWSESSLTWNNAPSTSSLINSFSLNKVNSVYVKKNMTSFYQNTSGEQSFVLIGNQTGNRLLNMYSRSSSAIISKKPNLNVSSEYLDQSFTQNQWQSSVINPIIFYDADGDALALSVENLPDGLTYDSSSSTISGSPTNAAVGAHTITVTADDGNGGTVSTEFELTVENVNDLPVINHAISDQFATNGEPFSFVIPDTLAREGFSVIIRADDDTDAAELNTYTETSFQLYVDPPDNLDVIALVENLPTSAPALAAIGITDTRADNERLYNAAIARTEPDPTLLAELQVIIDKANALAKTLEKASSINKRQSEDLEELSESLGDLDQVTLVPGELIAELAKSIDTTQPSPTSESEVAELALALIERATYHPVVWLGIRQGGTPVHQIRPDAGLVKISAQISSPIEGVPATFDWSATVDKILSLSSDANPATSVLTFDPASLTAKDALHAEVQVQRNSRMANATITIPVTAIEVESVESRDSDDDGVLDRYEGEFDASTNSDVANKLQSFRGNDINYYLQSGSEQILRLGSTARNSKNYQASLTIDELIEFGPSSTAAQSTHGLPEGIDEQDIAIIDFEIAALSHAGASAQLVVPLRQALHRDSKYMKFHPELGWQDFVEDALNSISSAPAVGDVLGVCPPIDHEAYSPGLTEGHLCIELTIEDGGPNDADRLTATGAVSADAGINGNIVDPGAITYENSGELTNEQSGPDFITGIKGHGSVGFAWLLLLAWSGRLFRAAPQCRAHSGD